MSAQSNPHPYSHQPWCTSHETIAPNYRAMSWHTEVHARFFLVWITSTRPRAQRTDIPVDCERLQQVAWLVAQAWLHGVPT
eukprot:m.96654 g.96654  ORF g.96654 m.96654 type:complete len:81 (-) comp16666_c0_seq10:1137-1379(-)